MTRVSIEPAQGKPSNHAVVPTGRAIPPPPTIKWTPRKHSTKIHKIWFHGKPSKIAFELG